VATRVWMLCIRPCRPGGETTAPTHPPPIAWMGIAVLAVARDLWLGPAWSVLMMGLVFYWHIGLGFVLLVAQRL